MNTTPLPAPGDLIDEREVASVLSVSVKTLRNWRWRSEGPRWRKIGSRCIRYYRRDVLDFIDAGAARAEGGAQ